MEDSEQGKSERPTPYKLQQARRKGSVARGKDLGFLTGLAAVLGYCWASGQDGAARFAVAARQAITTAPMLADGEQGLFRLSATLSAAAARPLAFCALLMFLTVLLFELVQTGVIFTAEPLKPDFSRLNPGQGLKRLFSMQVLLEAGRNILKLAGYTGVAVLAILAAYRDIVPAIADGRHLLDAMMRASFRLLAYFLLVALFFAAVDQLLSRRTFLKKMRMSPRDIKRESRDREGEPRLKQRRKQLHAEFVKTSGSARNLRSADMLITNPTHYAVGLRYRADTMSAPMVVAQGANQSALRLKRSAFLYGVTVIEDRELARALYHHARFEREIPGSLYAQVAGHYRRLGKRARSAQAAANG